MSTVTETLTAGHVGWRSGFHSLQIWRQASSINSSDERSVSSHAPRRQTGALIEGVLCACNTFRITKYFTKEGNDDVILQYCHHRLRWGNYENMNVRTDGAFITFIEPCNCDLTDALVRVRSVRRLGETAYSRFFQQPLSCSDDPDTRIR